MTMHGSIEATSREPMFVTGLHRGGTTWVGRMIAAHPTLEYIHEPFNPDVSTGADAYGLDVPQWWLHVHQEIEEAYLPAVRRIVELKPVLWPRLYRPDGWRLRREIWCQPREGIRAQPDLCAGLLKPFDDVFHGERENGDRLQQTCTTWNMFTHVMRRHSLADAKSASYTRASITRDSRRNHLRWRENLSSESIDRIRELTSEYSPEFYGEEEW